MSRYGVITNNKGFIKNDEILTKELWSPIQVSTWAWWDPSDPNTITSPDGINVSNLAEVLGRTDAASSSLEMIQPSGPNQPQTGRTINGLNVLDYNLDTDEYLRKLNTGWSFPLSGDIAVYCVGQYDGLTDSINAGFVNFQNNLLLAPTRFSPYLNRGSSFITYTARTSAAIYEGYADASAEIFSAYINGYEQGTKAYPASSWQWPADAYVSAFRLTFMTQNNPAVSMTGGLGEVIITQDVTADTRIKIEGYLAHKWRLEDQLPPDHKYKDKPPFVEG